MGKRYLLFLLLLIPICIFVAFRIIFLNTSFFISDIELLQLYLSSANIFATLLLGIIVFIQSENHKDSTKTYQSENDKKTENYKNEEREYRKQDLLIHTTPNIAFGSIEYAEIDYNTEIYLKEDSAMCLKYSGSFDEDNDQLERERPFNEYRTGSLFRFIFICNEDKGLKNIIFKNVRVYPDYPIEVNGEVKKYFYL